MPNERVDESRERESLLRRLTGRFGVGAAALWIAKTAVVGVFIFAGCGPIGPIPGGALSGELGPAGATDWSGAAEVENAQLETRPDDPHSVNTWFAPIGERLYVPTSMILGPKNPAGRSWVDHVGVDDRVRIRLGDTIYERRAVRVADPCRFSVIFSVTSANLCSINCNVRACCWACASDTVVKPPKSCC